MDVPYASKVRMAPIADLLDDQIKGVCCAPVVRGNPFLLNSFEDNETVAYLKEQEHRCRSEMLITTCDLIYFSICEL